MAANDGGGGEKKHKKSSEWQKVSIYGIISLFKIFPNPQLISMMIIVSLSGRGPGCHELRQ